MPDQQKIGNENRFVIDKKIPIALIVTLLFSTAGILWQGGRMQFVLEDHDRRIKLIEDENRFRVERESERYNQFRDLISARERETAQRDREVRDILAELRVAVASLREAVMELKAERRRNVESSSQQPPRSER
jgi:hypothetical protein